MIGRHSSNKSQPGRRHWTDWHSIISGQSTLIPKVVMDLLGDLGTADQLTSTRAENAVLKKKVKELEDRCRELSVENQALKAEVEIYREEKLLNATTKEIESSGVTGSVIVEDHSDHFVQAGNGIYANVKEICLERLNGPMNISCCSLSQDDTIIATGGAFKTLALCQWGGAFSGKDVVKEAFHFSCDAPIISCDFAKKPRQPFVAAGCMDGTVRVIKYDTYEGLNATEVAKGVIQHKKYVRVLAWASHDNLLASASADGMIQVHKFIWNGLDDNIKVEKVETLNLSGPVEALCFHRETLICYARGTPHLLYFDLMNNFKQTKINLNQGPGNAGFDDHVSFAVMDIAAHGNYLALATDTSRNIIIDFETGKHIRNLYGHKNDGFSVPKIAWSNNGQYLYGNTQDEPSICVWDVSSSTIIKKLENEHNQPIRDMYSSHLTDTLVTTSFDKKTNLWFAPSE